MGTQRSPGRRAPLFPPDFLAHVYCGETAAWMRTQLGTEVDLGKGHTLLYVAAFVRERCAEQSLCFAHDYCGHGRPSELSTTVAER